MKLKTSIVIPNYNGEKYLKPLFNTIAKQSYKNFEVILVDDNSKDNLALLEKSFSKKLFHLKIIKNKKNLGFAKTLNIGIKESQGKYVCLLNNDTLLEEDFIKKHVEVLEKNKKIGILSCKIMEPESKIQSSGGVLHTGFPYDLTDNFNKMRYVEHVCFCAAFVRRDLFKKYGLISEGYKRAKYEDADFCQTVFNDKKYKIAIMPDKLVTHLGRSNALSQQDNIYLHQLNLLLFQKKFYPKAIWKNLFVITPKQIKDLIAKSIKKPRLIPCSLMLIYYIVIGTIVGLTLPTKTKKNSP